MDGKGQSERVLSVRFARRLAAPVETVWAHLVECGRLPEWYGEDGVIEARAGGGVRLVGGHIRGVVTRCVPRRLLSYTWNVFGLDDGEVSPYPESYLTLELAAAGGETDLTLTHLPILDAFEAQNAMGWHTFLDMLGARVRGEPVEARGAYMRRNAARYGVDLNALAR
jgi:uncharacterized protein YndB with AHSA1/START domain